MSNINLATLTSAQGFSITGTAGSASGYSIKTVGDINGDGLTDLIIGAPYRNVYSGIAYVLLGSNSLWGNINLDNYEDYGFAIYGIKVNDMLGYSVSAAGDVNHDGYDDLVIGMPQFEGKGYTYVIFGSTTIMDIDLSNFPSSQGFYISSPGGYMNCCKDTNLGQSVSDIGDVNKDGYDDIIIGGYGIPNKGIYQANGGACYIIFGNITLTNLNSGDIDISNGISITGNGYVGLGAAVSGVGDFNKDSYSDSIVSEQYLNSEAGAAYILFGKDSMESLTLNSLSIENGISITGAVSGDRTGFSVSGAGDVNGDGYQDALIGAPYATRFGQSNTGVVYIIFGKSTPSNINLATLTTSQGYSITGINANDNTGYSVAGLGDINADGYDDVIISAPGANGDVGISYVIYGKANGFANIRLSSLTSSQGFNINGYSGYKTYFVAPAGDLNNDGLADMMISAPYANSNTGTTFVVYGFTAPTPFPTKFPTASPTKGPTFYPSVLPTKSPTKIPTTSPTKFPTDIPTLVPSSDPSVSPTVGPTVSPSSIPSAPTVAPTNAPTAPTASPSLSPSTLPTIIPTSSPTTVPTFLPTVLPSVLPTLSPTASPTAAPTQYVSWTIIGSGSYSGTSANDYFTINSNYDIQITGNGGYDRYIMIPHSSVVTTITDFSADDKIDLTNFANINDYNQIIVKYNFPTVIYIPLNDGTDEQIELSNSALVAESSFIINSKTGSTDDIGNQSNLKTIIEAVLSSVAISIVAMPIFFSRKMCYHVLSNWEVDENGHYSHNKYVYHGRERGALKAFIHKICHLSFKNSFEVYKGSKLTRVEEEKRNSKSLSKSGIEMHEAKNPVLDSIRSTESCTNEPTKDGRFHNLLSIDALMDPEYVKLRDAEFTELANHLVHFITEDLPKDIKWLLTAQLDVEILFLEYSSEKHHVVAIYEGPNTANNPQFDSSDNLVISLLNAKQILHNLPLLHYVAQNSINYLGYNVSLPDQLDNKDLLISTDLVLGNLAAQYLPPESIMNGMFISTASTASYAVRLIAADYLKKQDPSDNPIEFAWQCPYIIAAYNLPGMVNYALTKAILPDAKMSISTLDMLGSSSFGVVQCYNNYKVVYGAEAKATTADMVVPYIADAMTLCSFRGYLSFDASNTASLMISIKNAVSVAATTYAAHCLSNIIMDLVPNEFKENYVDQVFDYSWEAVDFSIDTINQVIGEVQNYFG